MGNLLRYDPFAIGAGQRNAVGVPLTTHSMGVPMSIGAPRSMMDPPPRVAHHAPSHDADRAARSLPWWRRAIVRACWKVSAAFKAIAKAEPPNV
jgi:hypothetical protein